MFVDASAMVAILTAEPVRGSLMLALSGAKAPITSPIAIFETVTAVARKKKQSIADSEAQVREFLQISRVRTVLLGESDGFGAVAAYARYGKGRGHPAQLNMGDCFAYACARTHDVPLLFVGEDFSKTDVRSALA